MVEANVMLYESKHAAERTKEALIAAEAELKRLQAALGTASGWEAGTKRKVQELYEANAAFEKLRCPPVESIPEPALLQNSPGRKVDAIQLTPRRIATPMVV